jgi:hypothetical protein
MISKADFSSMGVVEKGAVAVYEWVDLVEHMSIRLVSNEEAVGWQPALSRGDRGPVA